MDEPHPQKRHLAYRSRHRAESHKSAHAGDDVAPADLPDNALIPRGPAELVVDNDALTELLTHLRAAGSFAYDSEFIGELTYFPQLCLIQVATTQRIALIDPYGDVDLAPFWELLIDPTIQKLVHAGEQDVEPVIRHTGKPATNIFDTQIAAGFCRRAYPVALSKLVAELLHYRLAKGHTFTDWQRRPLSGSQMRYAADDVRFLPAMSAILRKELDDLGHADWVRQECNAMCAPERHAFDPDNDFWRIRGATTLSTAQLSVLRALVQWRESAARESDMPPRALVRDEAVLDLSRQPAKSIDRLGNVKFLPRPVIDQHGRQIVEITADALANPPRGLHASKQVEPSPTERFRTESVWAAAQAICLSQGLDPAAAVSRQDIADFDRARAAGEPVDGFKLMQGWRKAALGDPLMSLLAGKGQFALHWKDQRLLSSGTTEKHG